MSLRHAKDFPETSFYPHADLVSLSEPPRLWNINVVDMDDVRTWVQGWCLPPEGQVGNLKLRVNGDLVDLVQQPNNAVYTGLYPWFPNAGWSGFEVMMAHSVRDLRREVELSFEPVPLTGSSEGYYALNVLTADLNYTLPPEDIAARIGVAGLMNYVMLGRSIYVGFEKALRKNFGKGFADFHRIMDWGCGSARVGRHVVKAIAAPAEQFVGFDIDQHAVEWSNTEIGPYFKVCSTEPPLPLDAASIDLVYAYSVFTHLADEGLHAWTAELARVIEPGGVALVTVLSDRATMALFPAPSRAHLEAWRKTGIYDSALNSQLDTIEVPKDYYRNTWMTRAYIDSLIAGKFRLVDYVGSFHFYQDLLVLQRV